MTYTTAVPAITYFLLPHCPDCGKDVLDDGPAVRPANEKGIAEYRRIQRELAEENKISETP